MSLTETFIARPISGSLSCLLLAATLITPGCEPLSGLSASARVVPLHSEGNERQSRQQSIVHSSPDETEVISSQQLSAPSSSRVDQEDNQATGQDENGPPSPRTPLIRGLSKLLEQNPLIEADEKNSLRSQMEQADSILSDIKEKNREALRQASRQFRFRGAGSPNIIMIVADDLSLFDLDCYGDSALETPSLTAMANSGAIFTQHYSASPLTQDARWSLVTGLRPDRARERKRTGAVLGTNDVTIAEVLWQAGYATAVFGHWGVISTSGPANPTGHGYDDWVGTLGPADHPQPFPALVYHRGKAFRMVQNANGQQGQFGQDYIIAEVNRFLVEQIAKRPVFVQLFLSTPGPQPKVPDEQRFSDTSWPPGMKSRAAAVARLDDDVARIRLQLQDLNQLSNTIFLITADTPPIRSSIQEVWAATKSNAELTDPSFSDRNPPHFRGTQGDYYDGGLRIPLLMCGPGIPANRRCDAVSVTWDLGFTLYQMAGAIKQPRSKQGRSLLPHTHPETPLPARLLVWQRPGESEPCAARWQDWKLIKNANPASTELYDLGADPEESANVANANPEVIAEILKRLQP